MGWLLSLSLKKHINKSCLPMWLLYWGCLTLNKKAVWSVKTIPATCITSQKTALFS